MFIQVQISLKIYRFWLKLRHKKANSHKIYNCKELDVVQLHLQHKIPIV